MNAFERGWRDADLGADFYRGNPYPKAQGEWITWRNGYRAMYQSCGMYVAGPEGELARAVDRAKADGSPVFVNLPA